MRRLIGAVGDYGSSAGDFSLKVLDDEAVEEAEYVVLFVEIVIHYTSWLAVRDGQGKDTWCVDLAYRY